MPSGELIGAGKNRHGKSRRAASSSRKIARLEKTLRYRVDDRRLYLGHFHRRSGGYAGDRQRAAHALSARLYRAGFGLCRRKAASKGSKARSLRLDAVTTKDVVKAEIVMDDGKKIPLKIDGRKLQANLVLFQSQSYRIQVEDSPWLSKIRRSPTNCASSPMDFLPSTCSGPRKIWKSTATRFLHWNTARATISASAKSL